MNGKTKIYHDLDDDVYNTLIEMTHGKDYTIGDIIDRALEMYIATNYLRELLGRANPEHEKRNWNVMNINITVNTDTSEFNADELDNILRRAMYGRDKKDDPE